MTKKEYIVITGGEDGIEINKMSEKELFSTAQEYEGGRTHVKFLDDFPADRWNGKRERIYKENMPETGEFIVLKAEFLIPSKREIVTKWEFSQ